MTTITNGQLITTIAGFSQTPPIRRTLSDITQQWPLVDLDGGYHIADTGELSAPDGTPILAKAGATVAVPLTDLVDSSGTPLSDSERDTLRAQHTARES